MCEKFKIQALNDQQTQALHLIDEKQHLFINLLTGFGKSIHQALTLIYDEGCWCFTSRKSHTRLGANLKKLSISAVIPSLKKRSRPCYSTIKRSISSRFKLLFLYERALQMSLHQYQNLFTNNCLTLSGPLFTLKLPWSSSFKSAIFLSNFSRFRSRFSKDLYTNKSFSE